MLSASTVVVYPHPEEREMQKQLKDENVAVENKEQEENINCRGLMNLSRKKGAKNV